MKRFDRRLAESTLIAGERVTTAGSISFTRLHFARMVQVHHQKRASNAHRWAEGCADARTAAQGRNA